MFKQRWLRLGLMVVLVIGLVGGLAVPILASPTTLTIPITAQVDNCNAWYNTTSEGTPGWNCNTASGVTQTGYFSPQYTQLLSGLRFKSISIPRGATISEAHLVLQAFSSSESFNGNPLYTVIRGQNSSSPASFSTDYYASYNSRTKTSSYIDWVIDSTWITGQTVTSVDISPVIQEIVNRSDWDSGDNLALFWTSQDTQSTGYCRRAYAYSSGGAAPALVVTYNPAASSSSSYPYSATGLYYYLNGWQPYTQGGTYSGQIYQLVGDSMVVWSGSPGSTSTVDLSGVITSVSQVQTSVTALTSNLATVSSKVDALSKSVEGATLGPVVKQNVADALKNDATMKDISNQQKLISGTLVDLSTSLKTVSDNQKAIADQLKAIQKEQAKGSMINIVLGLLVLLIIANLWVVYSLMFKARKPEEATPTTPSGGGETGDQGSA